MTSTTEALKMAIVQLEDFPFPPMNKDYVIAKLEEALENQKQNPVGQVSDSSKEHKIVRKRSVRF